MVLRGARLARPGRHAGGDHAVAAALAGLARDLGALGGAWSLSRPEGPPVAAEALAALAGETRVLESGVIDLTAGLEAAWRRVDRKTRQDIQLARTPLRFEADAADLDGAYVLPAPPPRRWRGHAP